MACSKIERSPSRAALKRRVARSIASGGRVVGSGLPDEGALTVVEEEVEGGGSIRRGLGMILTLCAQVSSQEEGLITE